MVHDFSVGFVAFQWNICQLREVRALSLPVRGEEWRRPGSLENGLPLSEQLEALTSTATILENAHSTRHKLVLTTIVYNTRMTVGLLNGKVMIAIGHPAALYRGNAQPGWRGWGASFAGTQR